MFVTESLTTEHWIAIVRIIVGLWWIKSVLHKEYPKFVESGMINWTNDLLDNHPVPAVAAPIRALINFQPKVFPYLVVLGELAVGIGLTFGFLTPLAIVVGLFMNLNYLITAGVKPKDLTVNPCFRVEQGQNIVMIAAQLLFLATGAWTVLSVDSLLGLF